MCKAICAGILVLFSRSLWAGPVTPSVGGYYDQGQFERAIAQFTTSGVQILVDNFTDGLASLPGTAVSSDIDYDGLDKGAGNGKFVPGAYQEVTGKYSTTTWRFAQPIYAFGGTWTMPAVNAGLQVVSASGVYFLPDGVISPWRSKTPGQEGEWPREGWTGFWGFVSTTPMDSVTISAGDEGPGRSFAQEYSLSNLEVAAGAPEPGSLGMICVAMCVVGVGWRLRRRATPLP